MSLDVMLIGAIFLVLALLGLLSRRGKPVSFSHFCLFMGLSGLLIMLCGGLD